METKFRKVADLSVRVSLPTPTTDPGDFGFGFGLAAPGGTASRGDAITLITQHRAANAHVARAASGCDGLVQRAFVVLPVGASLLVRNPLDSLSEQRRVIVVICNGWLKQVVFSYQFQSIFGVGALISPNSPNKPNTFPFTKQQCTVCSECSTYLLS